MGTYFNPTSEVQNVGRQIAGSTYQSLVDQLEEGEYLIGLYDRIMFKNAPWLYAEEEYQEFERQVNSGKIFFEGFFAISEADFQKYCR